MFMVCNVHDCTYASKYVGVCVFEEVINFIRILKRCLRLTFFLLFFIVIFTEKLRYSNFFKSLVASSNMSYTRRIARLYGALNQR